MKDIATLFAIAVLLFASACQTEVAKTVEPRTSAETAAPPPASDPTSSPSPLFPDLQAELLDDRYKTTSSPLGTFDFKNFTYPLPRGWQHPEANEITLENGKVKAVAVDVDEEMSDEERAERKAARRIGMSYVTARFMDVTGDGADEAVVILKVETTGNAIPQLVYIYEWKDDAPALLWNFRTGDRADGGLKDVRIENSLLTVELYGQDRFLLGETETGKITGDEEQLCCPTHFTRSAYKWNGKNFLMQGKRLTFETDNPSAPPLENFGDVVNNPQKARKFR